MVTLYGLKACDTCRKARQAIEKAGITVEFVDVRSDPLSAEVLAGFHDIFCDALVNKKSTTWRGLSADAQTKPALELLGEHPTLMKRPVIKGKTLTLGWDATAQSAHLG